MKDLKGVKERKIAYSLELQAFTFICNDNLSPLSYDAVSVMNTSNLYAVVRFQLALILA